MPISRDEVKQIALSVISSGMRISGEGVSGSGLSWSYARPAAAQDPDAETIPPQYDEGDDTRPQISLSCCIYPYPHDGGGGDIYPSTDMPPSLNMTICGEDVTLTYSGGFQFDGTLGDGSVVFLNASTNPVTWTLNIGTTLGSLCQWFTQVPPQPDCLIGNYLVSFPNPGDCCGDATIVVSDNFTDTYTADGDTITRVSTCLWTGTKTTGGGEWALEYGLTTSYTWHLSSTGSSPTSDDKTAPQDGPTGTYGAHGVA